MSNSSSFLLGIRESTEDAEAELLYLQKTREYHQTRLNQLDNAIEMNRRFLEAMELSKERADDHAITDMAPNRH